MAVSTESIVSTELAHAVLNLQRRRLILALRDTPLHIAQLAKHLEIDRATASYHLGILENVGLVSSRYKILKAPASKGRAARVFTLNKQRLAQAIDAADSQTRELKELP